jgi:hypothetical protein
MHTPTDAHKKHIHVTPCILRRLGQARTVLHAKRQGAGAETDARTHPVAPLTVLTTLVIMVVGGMSSLRMLGSVVSGKPLSIISSSSCVRDAHTLSLHGSKGENGGTPSTRMQVPGRTS